MNPNSGRRVTEWIAGLSLILFVGVTVGLLINYTRAGSAGQAATANHVLAGPTVVNRYPSFVSSYTTLEDLVDRYGPLDIVNVGRYGAESTLSNVQFFYKDGLHCTTDWDAHFDGIKRNIPVHSCRSFDPSVIDWPKVSMWTGFDDD